MTLLLIQLVSVFILSFIFMSTINLQFDVLKYGNIVEKIIFNILFALSVTGIIYGFILN